MPTFSRRPCLRPCSAACSPATLTVDPFWKAKTKKTWTRLPQCLTPGTKRAAHLHLCCLQSSAEGLGLLVSPQKQHAASNADRSAACARSRRGVRFTVALSLLWQATSKQPLALH